jgi:HK97 gp10 family phage protein
MPIATFTVRGSEQLQRNLARLQGAERLRAQASALRAGAAVVELRAKDYAPVDTGALMNSIAVDDPVTPTAAFIGPSVEYAVHVEFGTVKMAAQPFLRPALDQHEGEITDAVEAVIAAFVGRVRI